MSYGFAAINTSGQTIISDEMENLHFLGKATLTGNDGGNYGDFPGYGGANDTLDGRVIFTYTITATAPPLVFIKPSDYNRWHAIITQSNSGSAWTFDVIASGTSTSDAPELYCFVNANSTSGTTSTHGLVVWKSDGTTRTFDSRYNPLAISDGGTLAPPLDPTDGSGLPGNTSGHSWNYATNDHDFRSTTRYTSSAVTGTYSALMFAAPSLAQATYKRQMEGYKKSTWCCASCCGHCLCSSSQEHWSTAMWWVMYRNTFRLRSGYMDAGWTNYAAGYSFSSSHEGGGWFGGGGGSYSSGSMPYTAKTINLTSNAYIIADATRYG